MKLALLKFSFKYPPIGVVKGPLSVFFVIKISSYVYLSIGPSERTFAILLIVLEFTLVGITLMAFVTSYSLDIV
jgi:hypothetical protein